MATTQFELTQNFIRASESFTEVDRTLTSLITEGYMTLESYDFGVFLTTGYTVVNLKSRARYWNTCRKILERIPGYKELPFSYQLLNRDKEAPIIGAKRKKVEAVEVSPVETVEVSTVEAVEVSPVETVEVSTVEAVIRMIDTLSDVDKATIAAYLNTAATTTTTSSTSTSKRSKKSA